MASFGLLEIFYFLVKKNEEIQNHLLILIGPLIRSLTLVNHRSFIQVLVTISWSTHSMKPPPFPPLLFFLLFFPFIFLLLPLLPSSSSSFSPSSSSFSDSCCCYNAGGENERQSFFHTPLPLLDSSGSLLPCSSEGWHRADHRSGINHLFVIDTNVAGKGTSLV